MKRKILLFTVLTFSFNCFSQLEFVNGYFIDNSDRKIECLIKNLDWRNNPTEFDYKLKDNSETLTGNLNSVKEFGIYDVSKYIRVSVNIDRSSDDINYLSSDKNPIFKNEIVFLKVIVDGKANLYEYIDSNLRRYFYNKDNSEIEQLIYKKYKTQNNNIGINNNFKQQLWVNLNCPEIKMSKVESLDYRKNDLIKFFSDYSNCNNTDLINFEQKQKRDVFNLTFRPRINSSSLYIQNPVSNIGKMNFENQIGFGLGLEFEYTLPFNKNKWSVQIEPTYQYFKSKSTINQENVSGGILSANINYKSIELPVTLRHYFFLNNDSKIFANISFVADFASKSVIEITRKDESVFNSLNVTTRNNFAIGAGYKHFNKYSIELRYQLGRNILSDYLYWQSNYKTISLIFGYAIF